MPAGPPRGGEQERWRPRSAGRAGRHSARREASRAALRAPCLWTPLAPPLHVRHRGYSAPEAGRRAGPFGRALRRRREPPRGSWPASRVRPAAPPPNPDRAAVGMFADRSGGAASPPGPGGRPRGRRRGARPGRVGSTGRRTPRSRIERRLRQSLRTRAGGHGPQATTLVGRALACTSAWDPARPPRLGEAGRRSRPGRLSRGRPRPRSPARGTEPRCGVPRGRRPRRLRRPRAVAHRRRRGLSGGEVS